MAKKWLLLGTITFSIGFGLSLLISRDLKRAALSGLIAIPATFASVSVLERQEEEKIRDRLQKRLEEEWQKGITVEGLRKEKQGLEQAIVDLESQSGELEKEIAESKAQKQALEAFSLEQKNRQENLNQTIAQLESHSEELNNRLNQLQGQKIDSEKNFTELEQRKQGLLDDANRLADRFQELLEEEQQKRTTVEGLREEKQGLERAIATLDLRSRALENEFIKKEYQKRILERNLTELNKQKQGLLDEANRLGDRLQKLLEEERQKRTAVEGLREEKQGLEQAIADLELRSGALERKIGNLNSQKQVLEAFFAEQKNHQEELDQTIVLLESQSEELNNQLKQLQGHKIDLERNLTTLNQQKRGLLDEVKRLGDRLQALPEEEQQNNKPKVTIPQPEGQRLVDAIYLNALWKKQLLPYWLHKSRLEGQRFLGSIPIQEEESAKLFKILKKPLQEMPVISFDSLKTRFTKYDHKQAYLSENDQENWIKIFTFLFSEYAYLYSESDTEFWQGLCQRLNISQEKRTGAIKAFRQITQQGIKDLGLIQTDSGYKYVSNLWLQNGIPKRNLPHFSQLVQETADDYGWWEIAHSEAIDIAEQLLQSCNKHSDWKTLQNFLNAINSTENAMEPISGELVQGIARVAQILEKEKLPVHSLKDSKTIERISKEYILPRNFFLRDWNELINILKPRRGNGNQVVSSRRKSLFLFLDLADTGNTQLVLPEQSIWNKNWDSKRRTACNIQKANWESQIPSQGKLEIPELTIDIKDIKEVAEPWTLELLNEQNARICDWKTKGIEKDLPCLIFDALRGTHISVHLPNPRIRGFEEIILFSSREALAKPNQGIEVIDALIPCSINGWQGQQIRILEPNASITLPLPGVQSSQTIHWDREAKQHPILTGLQIMNKKGLDTYLEIPTFWYPPDKKESTLNIVIENLSQKIIINQTSQTLKANIDWTAIPLKQWITEPDRYQVNFGIGYQQWSYQFQVQNNHILTEEPTIQSPVITLTSGKYIPHIYDSSSQFWGENIIIEGLWTLEEIDIILNNSKEKFTYSIQADTLGKLSFSLSVLYDVLSISNQYYLDYRRLGLDQKRLLEYQQATI